MIGWAGSGAEVLHLFNEEWQQRAFVLDGCLGHGVEVGLVGRSTTLGYHNETIFSTLNCFDVNLCRQVATCVDFVVHIQWSILRITQVVLCIGVVNAKAQCLFILEAGPDLLAFFTVDDGGAGILAEGEDALDRCLGIAEELQCHVFVVLRCLRILEDLCNLQVVFATQHELHIVECLLSEQSQGFF